MARIIDPDLIAQIVRQLNVQGPLAPFDIGQTAVPVFDIGKLTSLDDDVQKVTTPASTTAVRIGLANSTVAIPNVPPDFDAAEVIPNTQSAIAAGTVLADSGQLLPGTHYLDCNISQNDGTTISVALEWRNAANAADILRIPWMMGLRAGKIFRFSGVANQERFRLITDTAIAGTIHSYVATVLSGTSIA